MRGIGAAVLVTLLAALALPACGARTGLSVVDASLALPRDAAVDLSPPRDASVDMPPAADLGVPAECDPGEVVGDLVGEVHGELVSWNGGAPLSAGRYRIDYVDGCMKFSPVQWWTVNADATDAFWLMEGGARVHAMPGNTGWLAGGGGFWGATFEECVTRNVDDHWHRLVDHTGGALGVQVFDDRFYDDNVEGDGGRNPTWRLTRCR